jgi:biotin transport system substrate-specific component
MPNTSSISATKYLVGQLSLSRKLVYAIGFNLLLIASAYVRIPLPFTPVPITGQTMAVLACGLFLGPVTGAATVVAYLLQGALGLPVFAAGAAGLPHLAGPTGGYLLGFIPAAFVVGLLSARAPSLTFLRLLIVLILGLTLIYVPGLLVLTLFMPNNMVLETGLYPFLPGAAIKIILTASALSVYKRIKQSL